MVCCHCRGRRTGAGSSRWPGGHSAFALLAAGDSRMLRRDCVRGGIEHRGIHEPLVGFRTAAVARFRDSIDAHGSHRGRRGDFFAGDFWSRVPASISSHLAAHGWGARCARRGDLDGRVLRKRFGSSPELSKARVLLHAIVGTQILLGVAAYWSRLSTADAPQPMPVMVWLTVIHTVFGAILFAFSVLLVLLCFRLVPWGRQQTAAAQASLDKGPVAVG